MLIVILVLLALSLDNCHGDMIDEMIAASTNGLSLMESETLHQGQLSPDDAQRARVYILAHGDHTAYHLLFALRRNTPEVYTQIPDAVKANVLCAMLAYVTYVNDWGYLDTSESYDGEAATALIDLGDAALERLALLLDDERSAPAFGSEEATLSSLYHYRRKDFAYRYAALILGITPAFDASPQVRDLAIEDLKTRL